MDLIPAARSPTPYADMAGGHHSGYVSVANVPGYAGCADIVIQSGGQILYIDMAGGHFSRFSTVANVPAIRQGRWPTSTAMVFADVLLQKANAGGPAISVNMHNGQNSGYVVATTGLPADWTAGDAGDLNNDGFADVIVQQANGQTLYAAQGSNGFDHWGTVGNVGGHWHVV